MLVANPHLYSAPTSPLSGDGATPRRGSLFSFPPRTLDELLDEARTLFEQQQSVDSLLHLSRKLQTEFREHLIKSQQCMLPSHDYHLPTGKEKGIYLVCEVGGSTLRVASVELDGRDAHDSACLTIRRMELSCIDQEVRVLDGEAFFDWIAERTKKMLATDRKASNQMENVAPLRMGVAWSFPVEQTSLDHGIILGMGKGFSCNKDVQGKDIGDLITSACTRSNLNVSVSAIVNDASAAVLARAYVNPSTRLAVILGTGINAAIHLPITSLHPNKFGSRIMPPPIDPPPTHVLVNAELSMFGRKAYSTTRWDEHLNKHHVLPDYQPLEYLTAGGYMGEIVRLILLEAIDTAGLFHSSLPPSLAEPYCIDTRAMAAIELDTDSGPELSAARKFWTENFPTIIPISGRDMRFVRDVVQVVRRRSVAYFTAANHALAGLLQDLEAEHRLNGISTSPAAASRVLGASVASASEPASKLTSASALNHQAGEEQGEEISIGCEGSIINKYPGYMFDAQTLMEKMVSLEDSLPSLPTTTTTTINNTTINNNNIIKQKKRKRIIFEGTKDSAVLGAGVAVAMAWAGADADAGQ